MRTEKICRIEDDGSQTQHTMIPTAELDALRARCASMQAQMVAIAGCFNGWSNGDGTAENALFAIGDALGPPWDDSVRCRGCGGDGLTAQDDPKTCPVCNGTGKGER